MVITKPFRPQEEIELAEIIEMIRTGAHGDDDITHLVERIRSINNRDERNDIKKGLPAISVCGTFQGGVRKSEKLETYSQFVVVDVDDQEEHIERLEQEIKGDPFIILGFRSPSGTGYKALVFTDAKKEDHESYCRHIFKYFESKFGVKVDQKGKDLARLMFLSHDPNCYWNPDAQVYNLKDLIDEPIRGSGHNFLTLTRPAKTSLEVFLKIGDMHGQLQRSCTYELGNRSNYVHRLASWCNNVGIEEIQARTVIRGNFSGFAPKAEKECH